ncbi:hypothetical protein IFR05_016628 [Cadophora sp. M221]|nr:hypothetical protein IFR05_016628 [Cadophora sp. M221]
MTANFAALKEDHAACLTTPLSPEPRQAKVFHIGNTTIQPNYRELFAIAHPGCRSCQTVCFVLGYFGLLSKSPDSTILYWTTYGSRPNIKYRDCNDPAGWDDGAVEFYAYLDEDHEVMDLVPRGTDFAIQLSRSSRISAMMEFLQGGTNKFSFWSTLGWSSDIDRDSSSNPSFAKTRAWLSNCAAIHPKCSSAPTQLPTRVIDVGDPDGGTPCRVYEPQNEFGHYMALSHCWGPPELIFKTTAQTLEQNKSELPWARLSKTFREAIEVTRRLGVRYIWIDSLCILQDDEDDWNKEAANMGNIYKNAYLNLAATASSNGMGGLHVERDDDFGEIPMPKEKDLEFVTLKARKRRPHFSLEVLESCDPLVRRGWA